MKEKLQKTFLKSFRDLSRLPLSLINGGFTLIEILVAVLIIGILAAIAVPQYQRALLKSRYAALMPIAKSMANSNEAYYLEHGIYADDPQDLLIQGQSRYTDDTELEFGTVSDYAYILAKNEDKIPNNTFVVYQKHSGEFPGEIHCEALADNDLAESVCKSFGGNESIGKTLTDGYETYVLFGTGNGVAPTGDNGGDEPEEPTCPDNSVCDEDGNVTGCASGYRLRNEACETIPPCPTGSTCNEEGDVTGCATGYHSEGNACVETPPCPENAVCNEQGQVTGCSEGYIVNNNACEVDPTPAKLQTVANTKCPANGTRYVCTIKNGAVYRCDTNAGKIDSQTGECVSNGTYASDGYYERIYDADGNEIGYYRCYSVNSGHCYLVENKIPTDDGGYKMVKRRCANSAAITKEGVCTNGYEMDSWNYDITLDSHGGSSSYFYCSVAGISTTTGQCSTYTTMWTYDNSYNTNGKRSYVQKQCTTATESNPEATCSGSYQPTLSMQYNEAGTYKLVSCYDSNNSGGVGLKTDGTCPSGKTVKSYDSATKTYTTCGSTAASVNWETATCK